MIITPCRPSPSPYGEAFWSSGDVRQQMRPPLLVREAYATEQVILSDLWNRKAYNQRPATWGRTGIDLGYQRPSCNLVPQYVQNPH